MPDRYAYADLTEIKSTSWLDITGTTFDVYLLILLEMVSKLVDQRCNRRFHPKTEKRYFNGNESSTDIWLPDLLSVTTLKTDENEDAAYERTWAATDYILWPYSGLPKLKVEYDKRSTSNRYTFPAGQRTVELDGLWGYGDGQDRVTPYDTSSSTVNLAVSTTTTSVIVTDGTLFSIGQSILIDSEQMLITGIATNTLTVVRAINGTTAATHSLSTTINVYRYPFPIKVATLLLTSEMWKAKDTAFSSVVGLPEVGIAQVSPEFNIRAMGLLRPFVRREVVAV